MLKLIIVVVLLILVVKYWQKVKDVTALFLAAMTAVTFILAMYLHHLVSTWYMLKKKR